MITPHPSSSIVDRPSTPLSGYWGPDLATLLLWIGLVGVGLVAIYSTTHGPAAEFLLESVKNNFERQLLWVGICTSGVVIALLLPLRFYQSSAYAIYGITVLLLIAALLFGREINGAKSWLALGPVQLQVSELAKVGLVLAVAQLLANRPPNANNLRYAVLAVALIVAPALLIVLQNDMGTALVFFAFIPIMLFWSGLPLQAILLLVSPALAGYLALVYRPAAIAFSLLFTFGLYWYTRERMLGGLAALFTGGTTAIVSLAVTKLLQPYQVARIMSFTNPEAEEYRSGVGFHLVQSKVAFGSGGLAGKGFMEGTQTQGAYIPEQSTDFVFSVIGEEWGFIGTTIVLILFALLLIRLVSLGMQTKHPFGMLVAVGTASMYLIHVFINIGMTTGLLPVIGIPLPFISYGGSALLGNTAMLAIVLALHMRRDDFSIYSYY